VGSSVIPNGKPLLLGFGCGEGVGAARTIHKGCGLFGPVWSGMPRLSCDNR
jgi:hypothetical protein